MSAITLHDAQPVTATCVPNVFIDEYMTQANGEYVKIYLYLLRSINRYDLSFSLSDIADRFDCTERDVLRALKYWEKRHLIRLEYDGEGSLSGICFVTEAGHDQPKDSSSEGLVKAVDRFIAAAASERRQPSETELKEFKEKEDVQVLLYIAEQYLGRTLNYNDLSTIFSWYDVMHFPVDLIEYLVENCVSRGHTSINYMNRIAEDYASLGIVTVDEAKEYTNESSSVYHAVMKSFGIRGRNLIPAETAFLKTWTGKYGFSEEMISEACTRTINAIHEPSFGYANTILEKWYNRGIATLEDVKKDDESYQQSQKSKRASAGAGTTNRFMNFSQRDNDCDDIQNKLIRKSFSNQ